MSLKAPWVHWICWESPKPSILSMISLTLDHPPHTALIFEFLQCTCLYIYIYLLKTPNVKISPQHFHSCSRSCLSPGTSLLTRPGIDVRTMCALFVKMTLVCRTAWLQITDVGPARPKLDWFCVVAISLFDWSFSSLSCCLTGPAYRFP